MPQLPGQPKLHGYYNYQNDTKGELKWTHIDKTVFCGQRKNSTIFGLHRDWNSLPIL